MAKFNLTGSKTVVELKKEFNEAFGSQLKVYYKNKIADDAATLGELGLKADNEFECRANRTAGSFIAAFAEMGLKVKVYTPDEWVAVLDGLTLESTGKVKKNATKADMESMAGYQREAADKITPNSEKKDTQNGPKGPYDDFVKILNESSNLIYVPTDEINEDGITLEYPNSDDPQEALDQVYSPFMDVENGDIECAENVQSVCLSKDGLYCDVDSDIALAVLGGEIITAINRSTAIMVVGDITYSCEDGEFTALDSQREDIEQLEDVASDGSNFLLIDKLRDDIIIEDDDNVYYDAENDDEDSIDEFFRILEELSAEDEMEKIRNLEFANEQELVDYLDNDPDDIDLAYKLICAAYMKWYGYTEDDEFYVNCTTYYFNDNKDFHYERETDIDFG